LWRSIVGRDGSTRKGRHTTFTGHVTLFPRSPVQFEVRRNYQGSEQDTTSDVNDYLTLQLLSRGEVTDHLRGRMQLARRFILESTRGGIPADIAFLSLEADVIDGVRVRGDLNMARFDRAASLGRFQTTSLLQCFLSPRRHWQLTGTVQFLNRGDAIRLTRNERFSATVTGVYTPTPSLNLGADFRHSEVTRGKLHEDNSIVVNGSLRVGTRGRLNLSYAFDDNRDGTDGPATARRTFNADLQVWINPKGSLSIHYSRVARDGTVENRFTTVNFNQSF
jgi:hypothetical protein